MKTYLITTLMVVALLLCGSTAQAQTPTDDCPYPYAEVLNCAANADDPICDFQKQNGIAQSGHCDRPTAVKLAEKFPATQGAWTTTVDAQAWAICSASGPRRKDGKCGWFRITSDGESTSASGEDPIVFVRKQQDANREATAEAKRKAVETEEAELGYQCKVNDLLGLPCLQLLVFGPAAGITNVGGYAGGTLAFHIPAGPYKSGVEIGVSGGYGGAELDPGRVALVGVVSPMVQGVVMPWRGFGFVMGVQSDFRLPKDVTDPTTVLLGRFGIRLYPGQQRFALELVGLGGMALEDSDVTSAAAGGAAGALFHF